MITGFQIPVLHAQHTFGSLNAVWDYALSNNPENTIYQLKIEQAEQDKKTADSHLYPKATLNFSGQKNMDIPETPVPGELLGKPGETVFLQFGQNYSYSEGLTISKTLFDWQSHYQSKITKLNVTLRNAEKSYYEQTLKEQIGQVYYAGLTANEAVKIGDRDLEVADSLLFIAKDRFVQGLIDGLTFNQAKINRNNVFEKLGQSKQYQRQCLCNLKLLLGLAPEDTLKLTESILTGFQSGGDSLAPDLNEKYTELYRLQTNISDFEAKKTRAKFAPKIDFIRYYGYVQYQRDFTMSFQSSEWRANNYLALSISIPLFTGFSNKSQYHAAKISRSIAEINYQNEIRKSAINDSILVTNCLVSKNLAISASETYQISLNSIDLAAQKYAQGLIGLDEYLRVFDDYLTFENQYLSRLSDYFINKATIEARK